MRWSLVCLFVLCWAVGALAHANPYLDQVQRVFVDERLHRASEERLQQRWPILEQQSSAVSPFHQRVAAPEPAHGTLCGSCHPTAPHRRDQARRAFLNGHTVRMDCMVCHWRPEGEQLAYRWQYPPGREIATAPAGQPMPEGAKIAVLSGREPVTVTAIDPLAKQIEIEWQAEEEQAELHARLHAPLAADGQACTDCHQHEAPLLDLQLLGYSEARRQVLAQHPLPRFIDRLRTAKQPRIQLLDLLRR